MAGQKDMHALIEKVKALPGWRWRTSRVGSATILYPPDRSKRPITIVSGPSKHTTYANTVAKLRRAGADI